MELEFKVLNKSRPKQCRCLSVFTIVRDFACIAVFILHARQYWQRSCRVGTAHCNSEAFSLGKKCPSNVGVKILTRIVLDCGSHR